ncbi:MAG: hypothetical protein JW958_10580 [Candidatus Eisenbacteria bacterium]|nr:hypothetical protein [Candidatus Eisenbacteria bacterium]
MKTLTGPRKRYAVRIALAALLAGFAPAAIAADAAPLDDSPPAMRARSQASVEVALEVEAAAADSAEAAGGAPALPDETAVADTSPEEGDGGETVAEMPPLPDEPEAVTLSAKDLDLRDLLSMFSRSRGVNIVSAGEVTSRVSIDLHEVPFDQALRAVVGAAGYQLTHRAGIYYVRRPSEEDDGASLLRDIRTYRLDYSTPVNLMPILEEMLSPIGKVTAYEPLRTIVVEDSPEVLDRVGVVIDDLDRAPRQVLIEARIIEARLSNDISVGIDWSTLFSRGKGSGSAVAEGFAAPAGSGTEGLFLTWGEGDFTAALQGLEGIDELNTLAAPRLLALDGREAEIIIGGELGFSVVTVVDNTVIQSVQFLDTGTQLKFTPVITGDGHILMTIHPELSDGVIDEGLPSKTTAEVTTNVLIGDGQTLLIGGLIREREEYTQSGIPLLKRIPLLGLLFGKTTRSTQKTELITLITPHILAPGETIVK